MILSPDLHDVERSARSDAERKVARVLAAIHQPSAVGFHSVVLRSHRYKEMAEVDFVILWKGVVVVVEVKGGGVKRHDGAWYSVDRRGDSHRLSSAPMEQAQSAMFAMRTIFGEDGLGWFADQAIVITPDIEAPPAATGWKATHWLARDEMSTSALASALDVVAASAPQAPRNTRIATVDDVRTKLFGEFSRLPMIDAQRGAVIDEQDSATAGQARILAGLAPNDRIIILGGAGTGKSVVLAEAAKQEATAGRSVLLTFRSPGLRQFFGPRLDGRNIEVIAFEDLSDSKQFDVVLVDEAQDLMSDEAMDRLDRVVAGGRSRGRWRMCLDPNNQSQVHGRFDPDVLELVVADAVRYEVALNVRNTKAIVHMVQEYLGADVGDPGIVNGERIRWVWTESAGVAAGVELARSLQSNGVQPDDIWVIPVTAKAELDEVNDGFRILSPRNAKGLEAEHVILCDLPVEFNDGTLSAFYVAVTRPRVALYIIATKMDKKRLLSLARTKGGR